MGIWIICTGTGLTFFLFARIHRRLYSLLGQTDRSFQKVDRFIEERVDVYVKWAEMIAAYDLNAQGILAEMMTIRDQFTEMAPEEKLKLCSQLDVFYDKMTASARQYPRLRTSFTYMKLLERVNELIEKMPDACLDYNDYVMQLNEAISCFPAKITAFLFGFEKKELLSKPEKSDTSAV